MANTLVAETRPSESGLVRIVWRLDSNGSGGKNVNALPHWISARYLIIYTKSGTATITVNLYTDLSDVAGVPTDFPPSGHVPVGSKGPYSVSGGGLNVDTIASYVNIVEPVVENAAGGFLSYVIVIGSI